LKTKWKPKTANKLNRLSSKAKLVSNSSNIVQKVQNNIVNLQHILISSFKVVLR